MTNSWARRLKILREVDKLILASSNFEHYRDCLFQFLRKAISAQTVFLGFYDKEKQLDENPIVYGGKIPPAILRAILRALQDDTRSPRLGTSRDVILCRLGSGKERLGIAGALHAGNKAPSQTVQNEFRFLCQDLTKDFYFIREQMLKNQQMHRLDTLYQISKAVSETLNLDALLESIVEASRNLVNAQAASLAIADPLRQELVFTTASGAGEKKILNRRMPFGQGIVGTVIETGKPLLVPDVHKDKRFYADMDRATGFSTRSVLCVPMKVRNNIIGAIEVLNPVDRNAFTQDQIPVLSALAQEAAVSIENARLFQLATTDGLTGLATIRYFRTLLEYEMSRALRYSRPLSLMLLDIDFFKKINDTHGHLVGDLILKELARLLKASVRQVDIPARYGGEEFIVMLPESSQSETVAAAERVRHTIETAQIQEKNHSYHVTVSVGVASMHPQDKSNTLIERADQKLYQAKRDGRNRVSY